MTTAESRAAGVAASALLVAGLIRYGLTSPGSGFTIPEDTTLLTGLLERSSAEEEDALRRRTPLEEDELVDPNRAPERELDRLPGVGPALSRAIVEERESGGWFGSAEELTRVPGIGPASVRRIAPFLEFPVAGRRLIREPRNLRSQGGGADTAGARMPQPTDLNRAMEEELMGLPGIGPALAGRILRARAARGKFLEVEELLEIPGIGPATLSRIRPLVRIGRRE